MKTEGSVLQQGIWLGFLYREKLEAWRREQGPNGFPEKGGRMLGQRHPIPSGWKGKYLQHVVQTSQVGEPSDSLTYTVFDRN